LTIDENTKTVSIGSRDWPEVGKDWIIQSHLFRVVKWDVLAESWEPSTQITMTGRENPAAPDAYRDDELEPEEREFLDLTREQFSRLDDV
jgi:hypothetical protein